MGDVEMNVCSIGPNDQLLKAIQSNDLSLFKKLLEIGLENLSLDLDYMFDEPYHGTIMDICCTSAGKSKFAQTLLSVGVNVNVINKNRKKAPIHLASMNGCRDTLAVLLSHSPTDVNLLDNDGNSALHLAAKSGSVECTKLLLDFKDTRANQLNRKGFTPAYLAATSKKKNDELMLAFIRCPKVNVDMYVWDKLLRNVIIEKYPHLSNEMPQEGTRTIIDQCDNPFVYLYSNNTDSFISHITSANRIDLNSHDGRHTYLQYACDFGLPKVVQVLLDLDADPNGICPSNTKYPIFIAAFRGFADIIQLFLDSKKCVRYQTAGGTVLHEVIKGSDENHNSLDVHTELCDHNRSFNMLLRKSESRPFELDINRGDDKGNTCLHYAAKVGNRDSTMSLLEAGAYVGKRNVLGDPPLADISPKILESHLNKCIKTNGKSPKDMNYEIIFAYNFLCPPNAYNKHKDVDNFQAQLEGQEYVPENIPETDPLLYISEVPELRPLLKHPVLTSFLHLKWFAIKRYYKVNLAFYIGFWALLTIYTLLTFKIGAQNSNLSLTQQNVTEFSTYKVPFSSDVAVYLWVIVLGFLIALTFRELFQLISSPIAYVTSLENWLEISLVVLTSVLLLCEMSCMSIRNQVSAVVILLSWGELILLVGRHPALATHLEMFKRVTKNFLKFLVWYSILIVAFALSFYMLFRNDADNDNKFNDPSSAMFKTIVMLTGEFDTFGSLPFSLHPIVSHALFLLFIFLIAIVLVNLLNGLAVSDTQAIRADAEIVVHVSRVKLIHYFETMAVGDPFSWIHKARNRINHFGYNIPAFHTRQFYLKIKLFPDALQDSEIRILPNQRNFVDFGTSVKKSQIGCIANCQGYYLGKEIINEAKAIIKSNLDGSDKSCMEILELFEGKFNSMEKAVGEIKKMLNAMNTKSGMYSSSASSINSVVPNSGSL
ncbi:Ion transport domain,Ankyrin repeat-containing domain,Ankyrin repeat [Cinara cedri]|uniref:Ion transport domain,Ankyrin repeat-containing domain,Ankyrin repeat n=1 Tax=Cinara cedri TaxID=506608 RepID=A0A5E4NA14_9HEMI|nr:Ion transport domain,Ankyrin repeat-containing domain,Ankyrin repeat [Cinara cedri]